MFTFTFDTSEVRKKVERLKKFRENDLPWIFTDAVITSIQMDASRGKDFKQNALSPYRPSTIKERKKLNLQTQFVDLRRKSRGSLLDTLAGHEEDGTYIVRVDDDHEKIAEGLVLGIRGRMKPRNFYGVSPVAIKAGELQAMDRLNIIL